MNINRFRIPKTSLVAAGVVLLVQVVVPCTLAVISETGKRMGHISLSGPDGSIAAFAPLGVGRKVFVHINNSNPILLADSPERAATEAAGWEVAHDGMEVTL